MNIQRLKKISLGIGLGIAFISSCGMILGITAQAQGQPYDRYLRRQSERRQWRERYRGGYGYGDLRTYPYDGYGSYGRYGGAYGYDNRHEKGFRDGLDRGREDARDHRFFDPNNSSHYGEGDPAYRQGFRQGYAQGYREYAQRYRQYRGRGRW